MAIKRIAGRGDEQHRTRFLREARLAAAFHHPAIVQVFDLLTEGGTDHIVMEYVPGQSLLELLEKGPLAPAEGLRSVSSVAEGVAYAHERGVVHRDLKSENVLITADNQAKITDFGIARRIFDDGDSPRDETLTKTGVLIGSCRAMSPEQVWGIPVTASADLFSFGILLYQMFSGTSPFQASTPYETMRRVIGYRPPPAHKLAPAMSDKVSALIDDLLRKEPAQRPRDAGEVVRRLKAASRDRADVTTKMPVLSPTTTVAMGDTVVSQAMPADWLAGSSESEPKDDTRPDGARDMSEGEKLAWAEASRARQAEIHLAHGDYTEAEELLLASYPIVRERTGERSPHTSEVLGRLVKLNEAWDKPDQADRYRMKNSETRPAGHDPTCGRRDHGG